MARGIDMEIATSSAVLQGRYRIERILGEGGMGRVYLAHDMRLADRPCAIKEMIDEFIDPRKRQEANESFAREADTLARLKHPAIPAIYDRFDDHNCHYLVMEYVEGHDLEQELALDAQPMSESKVTEIARQLCDVLAYLHSFRPPIIYRDMKPSNVMITPSGRVTLIDFGIARIFKPGKVTTVGTVGFAAPEQYRGQVDPRSDIYSLGVTLHYLLTKQEFPPMTALLPVHKLRPGISPRLAGAVNRAVCLEPEKRPQTIQEFQNILLGVRAMAPTARLPRVVPDQQRLRREPGTRLTPRSTGMQRHTVTHRKRSAKDLRFKSFRLMLLTVTMAAVGFAACYLYNAGRQLDVFIRSSLAANPAP
jgi:serine/threonine protein kinase